MAMQASGGLILTIIINAFHLLLLG